VGDDQDVSEKGVRLLEAATVPYCEMFELVIENKEVVEYSTRSKFNEMVLRNESCLFFVLFQKIDIAQVKTKARLSLFDSVASKKQERESEEILRGELERR